MTHNNFLSRLTHFVANGRVSTPPCNSHGFLRVFTDGEPTASRQRIDSECCRGLTDGRPTVEYAVQHTLRYAFLLLTFLLLTPSNMWGRNFYVGDVLYIDLTFPTNDGPVNIMEYGRCDFNLYHNGDFDHGVMGEQIPGTSIVKFVFVEENMATGDKGKTFLGKGPSYETYKIKVQKPDGTTMHTTGTLNIDNDRTKNYIKSGSWGTYTEPAPTPALTDEFYIFGDGGCADWVKGWSNNKGKAEYKMTVNGSVASITFYNMKKQNGYLFKVWNKTKNTELTWAAYDGSKSTDITCTNPSGSNNISFNLDANADITVYTDGTNVWAKAEKHQTISSDYYLKGDFEGWNGNDWTSNHFTKVDDYTQTYTIHFTKTQAVKAFTSGWGNEINYQNIHEATCINYTKSTPGDNQIGINLTKPSDVTFTLWKDKDGNRKISIKVVESTEPEPDPTLQPWSGDSYKEWWLTGDFTKPDGSFDGWTMNPSNYKFVADGDNYQKMSITLDPNDPNNNEKIFHNYNGQKLTRFEIIRKDTWDNPRINKPQFDTQYSNCSLQTDWKDGGSNRMSLELTTKSVIEFKIWRWGTSASNAERKVTVTITPIEQFTVAFNDGNTQLSSQQVYSGEHPTKPTDPTKTGYKFLGWSETEGGNVVDVTTITITAAKTFYAIWAEKVTVQFATDGGEPVPANQEIEKGTKATKPATDPAKAGYNFTGWDWNFNDAIDADKTINAQYSLKGVESVTLDKATLKLVEKGATGTIAISTILPSDVLSTTTTWSSDNTGVATVNNGVVTPVAKGTATITCTVANATASKSAFCVVTVKGEDEDCEMVLTPIYNYIIGSTPTGGTGVTDKLFDPSKQSEQPTLKAYKLQIGKTSSNVYAYDNNGVVEANSTGDYWILEDAGTENNINLYYFKNATTGKYMTRGEKVYGFPGQNGDWVSESVITAEKDVSDNKYKWYFFEDNNNPRIINREGAAMKTDNRYQQDYHLHRLNWDWGWSYSSPAIVCGISSQQGNWQQSCLKTDGKDIDNPNYKQSPIEQDSKSYYRFAEGATMTATSNTALRPGDVVTVYCYNPSGATVTGTLTIGTENPTISLTAGQKLAFEYTITAKGATTAVVASNSEDFCVAGIEIARELPDTYKEPNLAWDTDLSGGVTQSVEAGSFKHTASSKSAGEITYSSSDTEVATVAADGTVTPVAAGTTVITATIEQAGCYDTGTASYNVTLTDLPKPEIEFVTLPEGALPQGLANQTIVVTTTGGDNFNLAITEGTGATLDITDNTGSQITATLSMGANATNIVLTASTDRTATLAQNAMKATITVSACIPDGADIFTFTLTGSAAATGQTADGVIGGTVDQTALGTVGTDDNPATVDAIKIKMEGNKYVYDNKGKVEVKDQEGGSECQWAMIPTGGTYKPSWSNNTYTLYYLKNVSTNKYMKRGEGKYGTNSDWYYYTTVTDATLGNGDEYKWFKATDNGTVIVNRADVGSSLNKSYHLHDCNQYNTECNNYAAKPAVPCGITSDVNANSKVNLTTSSIANPDMLKSVEYNDKTYYIISGGSITLKANFKAGDVVKVDTYNRQTNTPAVEEITLNADASSYTYTTSNEYVCVNNIKVWRDQVGEMINPVLTWDNIQEGATVTLNGNIQETVTHTATTSTPQVLSTITYTSSDPSVATVDANTGVVTATLSIPGNQTVTITATQGAIGCYNKATATYKVTVYNVTLEDLVNEAIAEGKTLTLPCNFNDDLTISQKLTINAQGHKIGNLTITNEGDLTLTGAMTANNLYISADQAASQHVSGQLKGADKLTLAGTAYMDLRFAAHNAVTEGWYAFTVPFKVSSTQGIYNVEEEGATKLTNETDYAIMQYQGNVRAEGKYGWIKTHKMGGMLQPGTLYIIAFGDTDYDLIRFVKASGNLNTNTVAISKFASGTATDAGWNGVGNPTLAYGNATNTGGAPHAQFLDHEGNAFIASEELITNQTYIVSSAFFIQASKNDEMSFKIPAGNVNLFAPRRAAAEDNSEFMVELSQNGKTQDRFFLSANEEASATYEIGHDLVKMGAIDGAAKVAQVAINGYGMSLCDAEFVLDDNNEAFFPLTITAPKAGEYTLSIKRACENQSIFVMDGNQVVWDLTQGDYTLSLAKGTSSNYSLLLQAAERQMPTDNQQLKANGEGVQKIILHNALRIIKNGKMYNVLGL